MKVFLYVLTSIGIFLLVFSFVIQNPHDIKIHYYFGMVWDGSLATLLLLTLGLGMLFGIFASSLALLKLKIRLIRAAKRLRALQSNDPLEHE